MRRPDGRQVRAWLDADWLRTLLLVVLLVLLSQVVAKTLWMLVAGPSDQVGLSSDMKIIAQSPSATGLLLDADRVDQWALFGKAAPVAPTNQANAPETHLQLTLVGVFAHTDGEWSGAIIAAGGQDAKLYHPGDSLPGNAVLYKVYPDKVLLKRLGHIETLSLETSQLAGGIAASETPLPLEESSQSGKSTQDLQQQRAMIIKQLALSPVQQGSPQGYKVTDGIGQDVQKAVGLRPGDVILTVNGMPLGTEEADQAAIQSFYERGKAEVEVQRGSSDMTLTYPP
jgi:general secretion pathway protein C